MDIRRKSHKKSHYYYNTKTKKRIPKGSKLNKYYDSLCIPPAYKDVEISSDRRSKVQATGIDSKGRKQYVYSKEFKEEQTELKFGDLIHLGRNIKRIRREMCETLDKCCSNPKSVLSLDCQIAVILFLVDKCNFRVGSEKYKDLYKSYGVTTLNVKHLTIKDNIITIKFIGKKGVENINTVTNKCVVKLLKLLKEKNKNKEYLFTYKNEYNEDHRVTERQVNLFLKEYHQSITVKMFRTWTSNYILLRELIKYKRPENEKEAKKIVNAAIKKAAELMHHTKAVSKSSYMNNEIIDLYLEHNKKFYKILDEFKKSNGSYPTMDRLLNLFLTHIYK
tara:strand:- start:3692 stop:4693 length:1002 start_codon:yes stop_codon:yes gene_type:complete